MKKEKLLLAVYGTMRTGGTLSHHIPAHLGKSELMEISGLRIHAVGACPGMKPGNKDDKCVIELWEFKLTKQDQEAILDGLDIIEGVYDDLYERGYIDTPKGKAVIYFYCGDVTGTPVIRDWMEWLKKPVKERMKALSRSGSPMVSVGGQIV